MYKRRLKERRGMTFETLTDVVDDGQAPRIKNFRNGELNPGLPRSINWMKGGNPSH